MLDLPLLQDTSYSLLPAELQADLIRISSEVQFASDVDMPLKDEHGEYVFYLVIDGHVRLGYQKHQLNPLRICGPGDLIGYGETYFKYAHIAHTIDDVFARRFYFSQFQDLLHRTPALQDWLIQALCNVLALKDDRIFALENHSVRNRVASLLLSLSEKFGKQTNMGILLEVKIDRETLAKLAGTVIESFSRQLSEMEAENIILRQGRFICIKNKQKLIARSIS